MLKGKAMDKLENTFMAHFILEISFHLRLKIRNSPSMAPAMQVGCK